MIQIPTLSQANPSTAIYRLLFVIKKKKTKIPLNLICLGLIQKVSCNKSVAVEAKAGL